MRQFIYAKRFVDTFVNASSSENKPYDIGIETVGDVYNLAVRDKNSIAKYYPIYPKEITVNVAEHDTSDQFTVEFTIPEVNPYLDYTVIFIKKGKQFNDRSNWTCSVHTTSKDNAQTVAKKIGDFVKNNVSLGLSATVNGAKVTVKGPATGEDYSVVFGDELVGLDPTMTQGKTEFMGIEMVKDLAAKCAADAGFNYTAEDAQELYPNIDFDLSDTTTFDVVTVRFTEPRLMGTHEEAVYQIIQIAAPKGVGNTIKTKIMQIAE